MRASSMLAGAISLVTLFTGSTVTLAEVWCDPHGIRQNGKYHHEVKKPDPIEGTFDFKVTSPDGKRTSTATSAIKVGASDPAIANLGFAAVADALSIVAKIKDPDQHICDVKVENPVFNKLKNHDITMSVYECDSAGKVATGASAITTIVLKQVFTAVPPLPTEPTLPVTDPGFAAAWAAYWKAMDVWWQTAIDITNEDEKKPVLIGGTTISSAWAGKYILIKVDDASPQEQKEYDDVRCTVAGHTESDDDPLDLTKVKAGLIVPKIDLVFTDITGLHGIGSTLSKDVPRVPVTKEPDGIACDGLDGVDGGAKLLVRAIVPDTFDGNVISALSCVWGYLDDKGLFGPLVEREGQYQTLTKDDETDLTNLGVALTGSACEMRANTKVLAAIKYKPPVEFDLDKPDNPARLRLLKMAVSVRNGGFEYCSSKTTKSLVRPPVVFVHGINSDPSNFDPIKANLEGRGFVCVCVDHSAHAAPYYDGNGDPRITYEKVKTTLDKTMQDLRSGATFALGPFAIQRCDIVAHSYGGLLSRWYVEQTPDSDPGKEFGDRRDVRKLITLGTPHRGSTLANISCEAFTNSVFCNAMTGHLTLLRTLGEFLEDLNNNSPVRYLPVNLRIRWHEGGSAPQADDAPIVPALEVLSVTSEALNRLNANPFDNDVAYGSIVGTQERVYGVFNGFIWIEPFRNTTFRPAHRSYFPWYSGLDGGSGQSDGIVPVWSEILPAWSQAFARSHLGYMDSSEVQDTVAGWLNFKALPRGKAHRTAFQRAIPHGGSRANAFRGAVLDLDSGSYRRAGVASDAIVQCQLLKAHSDTDLTGSPRGAVLDVKGGVVDVKCTGMVMDGNRKAAIVHDSVLNSVTFHKDIPVPYSGSGELETFDVRGKVGRSDVSSSCPDLVGPHGGITCGSRRDWSLAYVVGGASYMNWSAMRSAPATLSIVLRYRLPAPSGPSSVSPPPGGAFLIEGGAVISAAGGTSERIDVKVQDYDGPAVTPDVLVEKRLTLVIPNDAFPKLTLPYSTTIYLYRNSNGHVTGLFGTSNESRAEVYQSLRTAYQDLSSSYSAVRANP